MRQICSVFLVMTCATGSVLAGPNAVERTEWPFYRPLPVEPPAVRHEDRVHNGIDRFVLAKLEERGLGLSPEAPRRKLVRRLYLDLIGLPPTPDEVEAFCRDPDPKAREKLVDRLLENPRHGERWARFWLDLARYADTAGYEGDPDLPHAWRYRDYVIDSLNRDKPYDVFIREQIAGDEIKEIMGAGDLPAVKPEHSVALTFLRLAPFTEPRGDETRDELLSEMTSTVGSVFLGLTVGCAKCHDHKYDGIPTRDFYRMKAFFATVQIPHPRRGDVFQLGGSLPAEFYRPGAKEWADARRKRYEKELGEKQAELEAMEKAAAAEAAKTTAGVAIQANGASLGNNYAFELTPVNDGSLHTTVVSSEAGSWRFCTDGDGPRPSASLVGSNTGQWFGDIPAPAFVGVGGFTSGSGKRQDDGAYRGHVAEVLIYDHPLDDGELRAIDTHVATKYHGDAVVGGDDVQGQVPVLPRDGLRFWLDAADLDGDPATPNPPAGTAVAAWIDRTHGLRLTQDDDTLRPVLSTLGKAMAPTVLFDGDHLLARAKAFSFAGDRQGSIVLVYSSTGSEEGYGLEVGGGGAFVATAVYPDAGKRSGLAREPTPEERARKKELSGRVRLVKQQVRRLEPLAMTLRHSFGPPYESGVPTSRVLIRGEWNNLGEIVEPGFPSCVTGHQKPAKIRLDPFKRWPTRSRRMALARWIASPENPLTARVMVNRLWHWHFGRGIVANPSDFGKLGGGPSHPELLDWLAIRFVESKWSLRAMHRLLVTSSTYGQSSGRVDERAMTIDPENTLLWRFRRRRLEAETIRDRVLAVSGRLNPEHFGLPIFPPLPGGIAEAVKWSNSKWATQDGPEGRKRSIYIYQQRTLTMPFLQTFDAVVCDASRDRRRASVTPLQSLAMYNGPFVSDEARHFAQRIRGEAGDGREAQIRHAFRIALGRDPTSDETAAMGGLLETSEAGEGLAGLCRVLLNSNEFITID